MTRKAVQFLLMPALLILGAATSVEAQVNAQIVGTVQDAQQSVVRGANIVVTSDATGLQRKTTTNDSGAYTVPQLQPGTYRIEISAPGFSSLTRTGVVLQVAQTATLNFDLQLGAVAVTVDVSGETPLLDTSTSAIGGVVEPAQVENLPILGRNSNALMVLEPGVIATRATTAAPVLESHYQFFSINGSRPDQSQFILDGGNDTNLAFNGPEYTPGVEEVQEYRIQTSNFSAEYGNTSGGVINIATKSGTKDFHGSLFEYVRNDIFSANNFFSNRAGLARPKLRYNQFGGTVGGPILRNHAFFFFSYEGLRQISPDVVTTSVPTALQRAGNFSQTYNSTGQLVTIYDPATTMSSPSNPGQYVRSPFPGNIIPRNRLDPVALAIEHYYPQPNRPGDPNTGLNNYFFNGSTIQHTNNYSGRVDYQLSSNTQIMGRYSIENLSPWLVPATFGTADIASPGYVTKPQHHEYAIGKLTHTFSPTFVGDFYGSWARWVYMSAGLSNGFDPSKLGFPAYLTTNSAATLGFPQVNPGEMSSLGGYYNEHDRSDRFEFAANMTKDWGKHAIKFGGTFGLGEYPTKVLDSTTGNYSSSPAFTQGPNPLVSASGSGFGFASFLIGTLSSGTQNPTDVSGGYSQPYYGIYGEDDITLNPQLTVNVGVRWDVESPRTETHNEMSNFDFKDKATLGNGTSVTGGLEFPGVNGIPRGDWQSNNKNFAPRVGLAYSLGSSTVVRAGYGIFYGNSWGNGRNNNSMPQSGFTCSTQVNTSLDNGLTPNATLSNPFPNGFCKASGSSAGLLSNLGQTVYFINRDYKTAYLQSWNLNVQRALPANMVIQVAYSGSSGVHLPAVREYNQLDPKYLSLGSQLNNEVANPYFGEISSGPLAAATITLGQSLRPYPQFTDVSSRMESTGQSRYDALFVTFQKRTSKGFTASASYTWEKLIDDVPASPNYGGFPGSSFADSQIQNFYNLRGERALAAFDTPQTLVFSYVYELPFGPGKTFLNQGAVVGRLLGGWQFNGLTTFQSGTPMQVTGGSGNGTFDGVQRPDWTGKNPTLHGAVTKRLDRYFDTSQFTSNAPFTFGNTPRLMPDLFQPGTDDWAMSLIKNTKLFGERNLQLRAEAFNTFNRVQFSPPNTNITSTSFGVVNGQQNSPRTLQLGARLIF